jgi:hypothetical protein
MCRLTPLLASAALLTAAPAAWAQVVVLDEGSFIILRDGTRVGREDFSIRRAPAAGGPILVAQGNLVLGTRRVAPALKADTTGYPLAYSVEVRVEGRLVESYSGQTRRAHYASRLQRDDGESAHEFRLPPGTVAVDDELAHQLWHIARRGPGATVPVLVPRRNVVEHVRVELVGSERLSLDVRSYETTHLALRTLETGVTRDVWLDARGRLLKAVFAPSRTVAVRD